MADRLLPTTVVGSYRQPDWLIDREMLGSTPAANYRVVVRFRGSDSDPSNDRAVFRTITVSAPVA
jgi:hypothetical protein